jgi:hypothetical protein
MPASAPSDGSITKSSLRNQVSSLSAGASAASETCREDSAGLVRSTGWRRPEILLRSAPHCHPAGRYYPPAVLWIGPAWRERDGLFRGLIGSGACPNRTRADRPPMGCPGTPAATPAASDWAAQQPPPGRGSHGVVGPHRRILAGPAGLRWLLEDGGQPLLPLPPRQSVRPGCWLSLQRSMDGWESGTRSVVKVP